MKEPTDDLYAEAVEAVIDAGRGSSQLLQRRLNIGYCRAYRIIEQLKENGVLGRFDSNCYPLLINEVTE